MQDFNEYARLFHFYGSFCNVVAMLLLLLALVVAAAAVVVSVVVVAHTRNSHSLACTRFARVPLLFGGKFWVWDPLLLLCVCVCCV